jgi:hypothetical protein
MRGRTPLDFGLGGWVKEPGAVTVAPLKAISDHGHQDIMPSGLSVL